MTTSPLDERDAPRPLLGPYTWRTLSQDEMTLSFGRLRATVFGSSMVLEPDYAVGTTNRDEAAALARNLSERYTLQVGVFLRDSLVAWHFGWQSDPRTYFMANSGVLPEHQRRGIYTALLTLVLDRVHASGFRNVTSSHAMTNNAVLIAKLKAGFVLTGVEVHDAFGVLVRLVHLAEPLRREVLDFRVGGRPTPAVEQLWPELFAPEASGST